MLILVLATALGSCRYWSLYRFSHQFCEFDTQIELASVVDQRVVHFIDPVLPRKVLLRYLRATPFTQTRLPYQRVDRFQLQRPDLPEGVSPDIAFNLVYTPLDERLLVQSGSLLPPASNLFSIGLIDAVLRAACAEKVSLGWRQLDVELVLRDVHDSLRPSRFEIEALWGVSEQIDSDYLPNEGSAYSHFYVFDFLGDASSNRRLQGLPVHLAMDFDADAVLTRMHVRYLSYQLWLDFDQRHGRLLARRH